MEEMRPSEIRYSQSTISTVFDRRCRHPRKPIEDTFEAICEGRQTISSIPSITVCRHNDQWYTTDNRRLWVFKHLEALEKCTTISVNKTERSNVPNKKFTTSNEGISVGFYARYAPVPSRHWYKMAEQLLITINDRITQAASNSRKEEDPPVCELKTETSSKSDFILSNTQCSGVEINSDLESSNSNSNGDGTSKTVSLEDSTIKICPPNNEDDSSLDPLDECNDNADRKDALDGKLQSDDQRSDQAHELDQYQKGDQDQGQNDQDVISHNQKSIQDPNSLKRSHVDVAEKLDFSQAKCRRTEGETK